MVSFFAFLHHLAAFSLVAALAVEFVLIRGALSVESARRLQLVDLIFGVSAAVVLLVGFLRVFYFEKGAHYYFHSAPFIAKLSLFLVVGLLSIYPTIVFLSWRAPLKRGAVPALDHAKQRIIRKIIHWELAVVVAILLCAALMARGVGYVGA
jgi:putative membrane protein